jgi:tetratricopeptide (TPR) repeat protein
MEGRPFKNPRSVFVVWSAVLALVLLTGGAANVALARYVQHMRENDPRTYLQEAQQRLNRDDLAGALEQVEQALQIAPGKPDGYRIRGLVHFRMKHWQEAFDCFQQAIQRGDLIEDTRLKSMSALMNMKRYEEALALGKRCIGESYPHWSWHWYMATTYRALGKYAEAIPYYENALKGHPNDLYVMDQLAQAYRITGNAEKAEAMERRIAEAQASQERLTP